MLVEYIKILITKARQLPEDKLLGWEGHDIGMDICGALGYQGADGVEHDGWFNEVDEPILYKIFVISGPLDIDANNPEKWRELFEASEELK